MRNSLASPLALKNSRISARGRAHEGEQPVKFLGESVESLKTNRQNQKYTYILWNTNGSIARVNTRNGANARALERLY